MFKLRSKIMLSFSLIILVGTTLMVLFVNFSTRSEYRTFVKDNDRQLMENITAPLEEYYRINGSWQGAEAIFQFPFIRAGQMRGMMGRAGGGGNMKQPTGIPRILITDENGKIVIDSHIGIVPQNRTVDEEVLGHSIKMELDNRVIGFLVAGSSVNKELTEGEQFFLNRTIFIIVLMSLLILSASAVFSWILASRLSGPVSAMGGAAKKITGGDLSVRVPAAGNDELAQLSNSFNEMARTLEKNDKWRKQIIADSAHELRTPVSLIQGNLEMILDGLYEADESRIRSIYDETLVLSRLIEELQQLSSAESGSLVLQPEEIDLNDLIENVLQVFHAGEKKKGVELNQSLDSSIPLIFADYQKLKQVFANILANAFRHTPEGGTIEIRSSLVENRIQIVVEDSGSGIAPEDLEKIFERFYRTDSSRNRDHGGSGLGLAISREIIRLHGGKIFAESILDQGTSIFINFPLKKG